MKLTLKIDPVIKKKKKKGQRCLQHLAEVSRCDAPRALRRQTDRHVGFAGKNPNRLCMYLSGRICRRRSASFVPTPRLQERRLFLMQTANANCCTVGARRFFPARLLHRVSEDATPLFRPLHGLRMEKMKLHTTTFLSHPTPSQIHDAVSDADPIPMF